MNSNAAVDTIDIVDDVELLAILGLSAPPSPVLNELVVLDWEDMPELSDSEQEQEPSTKKRKHKEQEEEEEEDLFAEFDFIEVSIPPTKKQKRLLIQEPFVSEDDDLLSKQVNIQLNEQDIRLALELISSN